MHRDDPDGPDSFLEMVRQRQWSRAREYLLNEIAGARTKGDSPRLGDLFHSLASVEFESGNPDAALASFSAADEAEPTSALSRFTHAHFLANFLKDADGAEQKLGEAERLAEQSNGGPPDYASAELYAGHSRIVRGLIEQIRSKGGEA